MKTLLVMSVCSFFLCVPDASACVTMLSAGAPSCSVFAFELEAYESDLSIVAVEIYNFSGGRPTSHGSGILTNFRLLIDSEEVNGIYNWEDYGGGIGTLTFDSPYVYDEDRDWVIKFDIGGPGDVVPEPSVALLGTLGILGCLRRRR